MARPGSAVVRDLSEKSNVTRVVVLTHSYPYGTAETFVGAELETLVREVDQVIVAPMRTVGSARTVPDGVIVDDSLGSIWRHGWRRGLVSIRAALTARAFYGELWRAFPRWVHWRAMARLIAAMGDMDRIRRWLPEFLKSIEPTGDTVFYTYWLGPATVALGNARSGGADYKLVSRAHRIDLYVDEHPLEYLPAWRQAVECVDRLFVISEHGRRYITSRFPSVADRCEVARLGVPDPGFDAEPSRDGVMRVLSCSSVSEQKRLPLLLSGIARIPELSGTPIEWRHAGGGPGLDDLESAARSQLPSTISWHFLGQVPDDEILGLYRERPVDVFANVSSSEGVPVSIMEAMSCGVPTVATAVGGTSELLDDSGGVLLSADPTPTEIARALLRFASSDDVAARRLSAKSRWRTMSFAAENYEQFARRLADVAACRKTKPSATRPVRRGH